MVLSGKLKWAAFFFACAAVEVVMMLAFGGFHPLIALAACCFLVAGACDLTMYLDGKRKAELFLGNLKRDMENGDELFLKSAEFRDGKLDIVIGVRKKDDE